MTLCNFDKDRLLAKNLPNLKVYGLESEEQSLNNIGKDKVQNGHSVAYYISKDFMSTQRHCFNLTSTSFCFFQFQYQKLMFSIKYLENNA